MESVMQAVTMVLLFLCISCDMCGAHIRGLKKSSRITIVPGNDELIARLGSIEHIAVKRVKSNDFHTQEHVKESNIYTTQLKKDKNIIVQQK